MCTVRKDKDNVKAATLITIMAIMCRCYLWQTQMMCSSEVRRKIETAGFQGNNNTNVQFSLTNYSCGRDRGCVVVKWGGR